MAVSYYEALKISPTATADEIGAAYEQQYNHWRRLVTHHDPAMAERANQALRMLEKVRATLTDPAQREIYDAGLGLCGPVGGLGDPTAAPAATPRFAPPSRTRPAQPITENKPLDAWLCPQCGATSLMETRFCKGCGHSIGRDCPQCGQLIESTAPFCAHCGADVEKVGRQRQHVQSKIESLEQQIEEIRANLPSKSPPGIKISPETARLGLNLIYVGFVAIPVGIVIAAVGEPLFGSIVAVLGIAGIAIALRLHKAVSHPPSTQEYRQRLARREKMLEQIKQLKAEIARAQQER